MKSVVPSRVLELLTESVDVLLFPARKSPGKTPLKSTKFISNDYCRICRISLKISGRSKINIFGSKNEEFLKTLSLVLSSEINDATGLSQIVCQKCQREVQKFSRVLEQGKELILFREKCNEAFRNQLDEYHSGLKRQKRCAKDSPTTVLDRQEKKSSLSKPVDQSSIRRALIPKKSTDKENIAPNIILCDTLFDGSQESRRTAVTEVSLE